MKTKIKWFKEVLELEPASRVFFPLAKLLYEEGNNQEALEALEHGLEKNPDHLEARFLLVEVLCALEMSDNAVQEVGTITGMLSRYPSFWKVWAGHCAPTSKDSAMALTFLAATFQGTPVSWSQIIEHGISSLFAKTGEATSSFSLSTLSNGYDEPTVQQQGVSVRTRTMADLLADQGDYQGALDIYQELASACPEAEIAELETLIQTMQDKLAELVESTAAEELLSEQAPTENTILEHAVLEEPEPVPEAAPETVPEAVSETAPEAAPESVPEAVSETATPPPDSATVQAAQDVLPEEPLEDSAAEATEEPAQEAVPQEGMLGTLEALAKRLEARAGA